MPEIYATCEVMANFLYSLGIVVGCRNINAIMHDDGNSKTDADHD